MNITKNTFGELNSENVYSYSLENDHGMKVTCITLGCIITDIIVPDKNGNYENVVLGFDDIDSYLNDSPYFGTIVGRVAGRIGNAEFELDGKQYSLPKNENNNHLHGGPEAFDRKLWAAKEFHHDGEVGIEFSYCSPDGENGYPGNLTVHVTYVLTNNNQLKISYSATSDKKTLVNLTNHTYFNLSGNLKNDILSHKLQLKSNQFLELGENLLPTGEFLEVDNTPFDFRNSKAIKEAIAGNHQQIQIAGNGVDHPFLLNDHHNEEITLVEEQSGRKLTVETDEQSVVIYTSNMMDDSFEIRGTQARKYLGICLETQGLPDSIHFPHFSPCVLDVNEEYKTSTTYSFSVL